MTADVVIIGGGVIGSSIAYHLRTDDKAVDRVLVVERDPTYARASSRLAMGGIRQQFCSTVNVALARYSVAFYEALPQDPALRSAGIVPAFHQRGYLFLVDAARAERFERRLAGLVRAGARVDRLTVDEIRARVPDLWLDDILFGVLGPEDGYGTPRAVLAALGQLARNAGAAYVPGEVTRILREAGRVRGVVLESGETITAPVVVNAAGPFAARVAALAGVALPVRPVRQHLFRAVLPRVWPYRFPMVVDPEGVHWRHEDPEPADTRDRIIVAFTRPDEPAGENFACETDRWYREFLPALVRRLPAFSALALADGWVGLYEMSPDHNPALGEHPELAGFYLANGFSGHGLMVAPAVGKVVSELIRLGRSETVDVRPLRPDRFEAGQLMWDEAMI